MGENLHIKERALRALSFQDFMFDPSTMYPSRRVPRPSFIQSNRVWLVRRPNHGPADKVGLDGTTSW